MEENACPERGLPLHLRPGIRGCLAVIAVGLVLVALIHLPGIAVFLYYNVQFFIHRDPMIYDRSTSSRVFGFVGITILILFYAVTMALFFMRKRTAPRLVVAFAISGTLWFGLQSILVNSIPNVSMSAMYSEFWILLALTTVLSIYLRKAQVVKRTFTE